MGISFWILLFVSGFWVCLFCVLLAYLDGFLRVSVVYCGSIMKFLWLYWNMARTTSLSFVFLSSLFLEKNIIRLWISDHMF